MSQTQDLQNLTGLLSRYSKSKPTEQKLTINLMPKNQNEKQDTVESESASQEEHHQEDISSSFENTESFSQHSSYPQSNPPQTGSVSDDENNKADEESETFSQSQDQTSLDIQMPDTLPEIFTDPKLTSSNLKQKQNPNLNFKQKQKLTNSKFIDTQSSNQASL